MKFYSDDYLKCIKCKEVDHEGIFCRCESRNIRIARERIKNGENPWSKEVKKPTAS
jgi:hypothetical protein